MEKFKGESLDIKEQNMIKLKEFFSEHKEEFKQLFPEVYSEKRIDLDLLGEILGDNIEIEEERYSFNWNGKRKSIRISQTPSTGTLRPAKEDSKNWDTTENLYIEGDNLEVLKLFQKTYHGKIKMIYIDPPYNTGKDFVYKDNYRDNIENYLEYTGQNESNIFSGGGGVLNSRRILKPVEGTIQIG